MKHKLTVLTCLVVVVGVGVFGARLTSEYHHAQSVAAQKSAAAEKLNKEAQAKKQALFQSGVQLDEAQCAKDKAAYQNLTLAERAKTSAPDCEVNIVE